MTLRSKAIEMRNAIDAIDLALHGDVDWAELSALWGNGDDDFKIRITMSLGELRHLCAARDECNRIINSPEYLPNNLPFHAYPVATHKR